MFQPKIFPKSPKFSPGVPAVPAGFRDSVTKETGLVGFRSLLGLEVKKSEEKYL